MSTTTSQPPMLDGSDRIRASVVLATVTIGTGLMLPLLLQLPLPAFLYAVVCVAVVVVFRASVGAFAVLLMTLGYRLLPLARYSRDSLLAFDILLAIMLVAFLAAAFRYIQLDARRLTRLLLDWVIGNQKAGLPLDPHGRDSFRPLEGWLMPMGAALLLSQGVLLVIPDWSRPTYGLMPMAVRMIAVLWVVFLVWLVLATAFAVIRWRSYSPRQARVLARHLVAREMSPQSEAIQRALRRRSKSIK